MNTESENRGRRVTDQHGGLLEAAHQAVQIKGLEGDMKLLTSQVSQNFAAFNAALGSLQIESRTVVTKLQDLAGLQYSHDNSKDSLDDMREEIKGLGSKLERWFEDSEREQAEWRREHEAENENVKRDLQKDIHSLHLSIARIFAVGGVVVLLGGSVIGGFFWVLNDRFNSIKTEIAEERAERQYNRSLIDKNADRLREVELYLARGGAYRTNQQEKNRD